MTFDDLDAKMRVFETSHDFCVLPGIYMVARLDGRGFTRLTKEVHKFEAPFDERFRDHMLAVVQHLVGADFRVEYGYTQSDEISLLFQLEADLFNRKLRKLDSILAAEASAVFSLRLGAMGCFDCRISQLPNAELVREYFRWRQEDATRNALNAHCYWALRKEGKSATSATNAMKNLSRAEKNELLFQRGVSFNDVPVWQKRGSGVYWETYEKDGLNPMTGQAVKASRRRLKVDIELPMRTGYDEFLALRIREASASAG